MRKRGKDNSVDAEMQLTKTCQSEADSEKFSKERKKRKAESSDGKDPKVEGPMSDCKKSQATHHETLKHSSNMSLANGDGVHVGMDSENKNADGHTLKRQSKKIRKESNGQGAALQKGENPAALETETAEAVTETRSKEDTQKLSEEIQMPKKKRRKAADLFQNNDIQRECEKKKDAKFEGNSQNHSANVPAIEQPSSKHSKKHDDSTQQNVVSTQSVEKDSMKDGQKISKKKKKKDKKDVSLHDSANGVHELSKSNLQGDVDSATDNEIKKLENDLSPRGTNIQDSKSPNGYSETARETEAGDKDDKISVTPSAMQNGKGSSSDKKAPSGALAFKRVDVGKVEFLDPRLTDNSYWAKDGADDGYGAKAQAVLGLVRGKDFRHEKTKKKRGSYRGGVIGLESHSIKFENSDEE
ncbi:hypothetical protein KP509_18G012900 [Ceratopteris richardii]|nr:hypothetical protein KP509_18G012900 [Ceratopteris richardii]KAH7365188.1 hypothetical protein KP509_18G012900 [Ceratopteris richardii]